MPKIEKIVLNMGVGEATGDTKKVHGRHRPGAHRRPEGGDHAARKAISTFKVRENMPIGAKVTLRKTRMYEFLDRLVTVALPRVRDFRGLDPKSFDGRGNYALGVKEHIIFPEIDYDKAEAMLGLDIVVCTTAGPTTRRARCCAPSTSRSGSELATLRRGKLEAFDGKEKRNREQPAQERIVKKFAARRERLLDIANNQELTMDSASSAPQARRAAAQRRRKGASAIVAR